jgi:hypothetical protein
MADGLPNVCDTASPEIMVKILDGVIAQYDTEIAEEEVEKAAILKEEQVKKVEEMTRKAVEDKSEGEIKT